MPCDAMAKGIAIRHLLMLKRRVRVLPKTHPAPKPNIEMVPNVRPNSCGESPSPPLCGASMMNRGVVQASNASGRRLNRKK